MFEKIRENILTFTEEKEQLMFRCTIIGFVFLTILGIYFHETWLDEAQAWLIAQNLSFPELIDYLKYEGHLFVWYTILMPFAKLGAPYPITMQIINWLFALGTVLVLWKKAPFNSVVKVLITFSVPICYQYAVIARCYSVGIFLLFLLLVYYKDKLKHPYLYPILVFLCANTSVMCLFPASALGILFFIDYIRSNRYFYKQKEFYFIYFVVIFSIWFIGLQLLGGEEMTKVLNPGRAPTFNWIINTYSENALLYIFKSFIVVGWIVYPLLVFRKNINVIFFFICTTAGLYLLFYFVYSGRHWHYYFFYIYLIGSLWLFNLRIAQKDFFTKCLNIFFILVSIASVYLASNSYNMDISNIYDSAAKFAKKIKIKNLINNKEIYIYERFSFSFVPYLQKYGIKVYDATLNKKAEFYDYRGQVEYFSFSKSVISYNLKGKDTYILVNDDVCLGCILDEKHWNVKLVDIFNKAYLYKIKYKKLKTDRGSVIHQ